MSLNSPQQSLWQPIPAAQIRGWMMAGNRTDSASMITTSLHGDICCGKTSVAVCSDENSDEGNKREDFWTWRLLVAQRMTEYKMARCSEQQSWCRYYGKDFWRLMREDDYGSAMTTAMLVLVWWTPPIKGWPSDYSNRDATWWTLPPAHLKEGDVYRLVTTITRY